MRILSGRCKVRVRGCEMVYRIRKQENNTNLVLNFLTAICSKHCKEGLLCVKLVCNENSTSTLIPFFQQYYHEIRWKCFCAADL